MTDEWCDLRWGDLATLEYGKALRGYDGADGRFRVFGTNGPIGWHEEPLCNHPSVIIGRKGAYRGVYFSRDPFFVIDTAFYLEPKAAIDARWAYYELLTHDINAMDSGSAIPSTSRDSFYALPVRVPPLPEQRRIGEILGALDDKIELSQRMNDTLEAITRSIFKSWFINFDPVRAKAEGQPPFGMDAEIAALFPDSFEDSALGKIPQGWTNASIGDLAENLHEITRPDEMAPSTPYIALEHMPRQSITLGEWAVADGVASAKYRFRRGDLLFGKLRPYFHKTGVAPLDGVCSTDILVIRPKSHDWFGFLLGYISSSELVDYVSARAYGTKMPRTNWEDIANYPVILPDSRAASAFALVANPLVGRIRSNIFESRTLATIRDTLLPKLMSSEIRVREAEKIVESVARLSN